MKVNKIESELKEKFSASQIDFDTEYHCVSFVSTHQLRSGNTILIAGSLWQVTSDSTKYELVKLY